MNLWPSATGSWIVLHFIVRLYKNRKAPFNRLRYWVRSNLRTWVFMQARTMQKIRSAMFSMQFAVWSSQKHRAKIARHCMMLEQQMMYWSHGSGLICRRCITKIRFADAARPMQQQISQHKHGIFGRSIWQHGKIPRQHLYFPSSPRISSLCM